MQPAASAPTIEVEIRLEAVVSRFPGKAQVSKARYNVLAINTGSSSVRLGLYRAGVDLQCLYSRHLTAGIDEVEKGLGDFLRECAPAEPDVVVHRIVHGGGKLRASDMIDEKMEREIEHCIPLAPLHNPRALRWIRGSRALFGDDTPQLAVFDTGFFRDLPEVAWRYALPRELADREGLRRYGFHGIAHQALWRRWAELNPDSADSARVISLQLGSGCSASAIRGGVPVDTSMGFSPTEGLIMATRSGDVDPGIITWLQQRDGLDGAAIEQLLNQESGLRGVSGLGGDMQKLLASAELTAGIAIEMFCYRARKYIGSYSAVLGGVDAILFGGGIGEHAPEVRERILRGLQFLGVTLDPARNRDALGGEYLLHSEHSKVQVWAIPVDEGTQLAREALDVLRVRAEDPPGQRRAR
jgi:acetate kinase